jgi:hypothetical protein
MVQNLPFETSDDRAAVVSKANRIIYPDWEAGLEQRQHQEIIHGWHNRKGSSGLSVARRVA